MKTTIFAALTALAMAAPACPQTPEAAVERLDGVIDGLSGLGPGYSVVVVTADDALMRRVDGERRASTGAAMTADTPQYIASQTKAFMGLLAARLDAEGILDLDSVITDYWPDIEFPEGVDPSAYTLRQLITHQVPIQAERITGLEASIMPVTAGDYPRLIAQYGSSREPGYQYDNLGYNIYAAILETATGRTWKQWLDLYVFDPLGMDRTSSRTSDFDVDELAWGHVWEGEDDGWYEVPPKTDGIMQSAGGLVVSPNDMITWLQLQLRGEGPADSGITAGMVEAAQTGHGDTHIEARTSPIGVPCPQYALGWFTCELDGHAVYFHDGAYPGTRSAMAFSPDLGVGIAASFNTDNETIWLARRLIRLYFEFLLDNPAAEGMAERWTAQYPVLVGETLEANRTAMAERYAAERWSGWEWAPDREALAEYEGVYTVDDDPYQTLDIRLVGDGLVLHWGEIGVDMTPAVEGRFGARFERFGDIFQVVFSRNEAGDVAQLDFLGTQYERRPAG